MLLLHGFPEFWWSWRHQLVALGEAGFHAVAPDLRGYGGSDKPPRGYDAYTLSADVAGLVRALGAADAHLVGHDYGGYLGWTTATLHPRSVRTLTALSIPHPLRMQAAVRGFAQARASAYIAMFQLPMLPEARLSRGTLVAELLERWGGPGFPDAEVLTRCREAMAVPAAAHCALEYYRWAVRSQVRPEGLRFAEVMERGVTAPVLHLTGALDSCILTASVQGSDHWAHGGYELKVLPGVGHFPHQEAPKVVTDELLASLGRPG